MKPGGGRRPSPPRPVAARTPANDNSSKAKRCRAALFAAFTDIGDDVVQYVGDGVGVGVARHDTEIAGPLDLGFEFEPVGASLAVLLALLGESVLSDRVGWVSS